MNVDLDSLKWCGLVAHKFVTGLGVTWLTIDRLWERFWKVEEFIERRAGGDRRKHMDVFALPQFVKDVVQLCNDLKAAESVVAPQFPNLIADAERIKVDGEKLLGIGGTPTPPNTPPA